MPRMMPIDDLPPNDGGGPPPSGGRVQLLYTLRPNEDTPEIGDNSDATFYDLQFNLPTIRRLSVEGLVADTHTDDNALIQHVIVCARAKINTPPVANRYTNAEVTLVYESGEFLYVPVTMWDQNAFGTRCSGPIEQSPRGNDWTLPELLELYIGGAVTVQGGVSPSPKFTFADVWVEVYGIPSSELVERKFESGVYSLDIAGEVYIAALSIAETRSVYETARGSDAPLSFTAVVLDNGDLGSPAYVVNSSYAGMITAIQNAGGGSEPVEEM